jgi:hypothetical protein
MWPLSNGNRNYELKITNFEFPFIWLDYLKFVECRKSNIFVLNYHFEAHFLAPCILPPGAASQIAITSYATRAVL